MSKHTRLLENVSKRLIRVENWTTDTDEKLDLIKQEIEAVRTAINWRTEAPLPLPRVVASGTFIAAIDEDDIVAGGKIIVLTLTDDTWVATGGAFEAQRQAIIDKLVSNGSETFGWNNIRSGIAVTDVARTSATVATITLPALPTHDISVQEVVSTGAPAAALVTSGSDLEATETSTIAPVIIPSGDSEHDYWAPDDNANIPDPPALVGAIVDGTAISTIGTFFSIGMAWPTTNGGPAIVCRCFYRENGAADWLEGHELVWDDRVGEKEYRGSIVHAKENTLYDIRLELVSTTHYKETTHTTWKWNPPEDPTPTLLPLTSSTRLSLNSGDNGTAGAYKVITFDPANGSATIDVADGDDYCIEMDGCQYIILRVLNLLNPSINNVRLKGGTKDVFIEECVLKGWGRPGTNDFEPGFGENKDGAIANHHSGAGGGKDVLTERIIIRRNQINSPRYDSNHWNEPEKTHPKGPAPIWIVESAGNHCIAYNEIKSGNGNKFLDGLFGRFNTSDDGFPGPNSDIWGNVVRDCNDDAIELEGSGRNVRVWGNYIDTCFVAFATTIVNSGPLYIWRNVVDRLLRNQPNLWGSGKEKFSKSQGISGAFGGGAIFEYNNSLLQTDGQNRGASQGVSDIGSANSVNNMKTRNNQFHLSGAGNNKAIEALPDVGNNDFNFDMTTGYFNAYAGAEANGITGVAPIYKSGTPTHSPDAPTGDYELDPTSRGHGEGEYVPNFCANMQGVAPDIGAHEKDTTPMQFGIGAFL